MADDVKVNWYALWHDARQAAFHGAVTRRGQEAEIMRGLRLLAADIGDEKTRELIARWFGGEGKWAQCRFRAFILTDTINGMLTGPPVNGNGKPASDEPSALEAWGQVQEALAKNGSHYWHEGNLYRFGEFAAMKTFPPRTQHIVKCMGWAMFVGTPEDKQTYLCRQFCEAYEKSQRACPTMGREE